MQPNAAHELRFAVESLPRPAREALLKAVGQGDLLTGVYSSGGQVCPSVAVHRLGPGERMAGFARAWDAYTGAGPGAGRQATAAERERLRAMIERSLARAEPDAGDLRTAMAAIGTPDPLDALARSIEIREQDPGRAPRDRDPALERRGEEEPAEAPAPDLAEPARRS